MLKKIVLLSFILIMASCSGSSSTPAENPPSKDENSWRYFDREIYMPTGVSVQPEMAAAQELIQASLIELADSSDLGKDYFIFKFEEDSLLQPVSEETQYDGRPWFSFIQVWPDNLFNDQISSSVGTSGDPDVLVVRNELNEREFYAILRLSCFVAGESCGFPTQKESKAVIWRAMGYLIGLKHSENANSLIMKPGVSSEQEKPEEIKKYLAEFDGQLERTRNKLPDAK
ncbi:MAG: hypothetical protein NTX25_12190 [Proteobacteria bacterium]|nr:hypothetical protein [Pseudomonadota bacterium]